ncbi:MAG: toll/interleukin-1 receptor domain-containing protein [Verrucomicrobiota bacterium]|jgi:hypothetical protein
MKVFLSYSAGDASLARKIASGLRREGLAVWLPEEEILPGDNWAERISQALNECDAMVALLTQDTPKSGNVQWDIGYALGNKAYRHRVVPVLVGREDQVSLQVVPWILSERSRVVRLTQPDQPDETVREIAETLAAAA